MGVVGLKIAVKFLLKMKGFNLKFLILNLLYRVNN